MNETNKIIRVSAENGYEPCVKEYPIDLSALEALTKFACERLGLDYNKVKDQNKARAQMGVSRDNGTAYFYSGEKDTTYFCHPAGGRLDVFSK